MNRSPLLLLTFLSACASASAQKQPAPPPAAPPPAEPEARPAEPPTTAPAAVTAQPCKQRRVSFTMARAVGMGSYITTLVCAENRFTVVMDRATPDGREVKTAFAISHDEWEQAWREVERLGWRTYDDRCSARETAQGRGDGPVYRITIEEPTNRRSFMCQGARELAQRLDALQTELLALTPPETISMAPAGVGVPACDDYLERYEKCVRQRVPADKRQGFLDGIVFTRQALHETLMRKPDADEALSRQCKEMHAAARSAMATFKCKM
jgi:hypothetical protein